MGERCYLLRHRGGAVKGRKRRMNFAGTVYVHSPLQKAPLAHPGTDPRHSHGGAKGGRAWTGRDHAPSS